MKPLTAGVFLALTRPALAELACNFNVSSAFAAANGCDTKCLSILHHANAYDHTQVGTDFAFSFYATARNFSSSSKPGALLKLQPVSPTPLTIPAGTTVYRMQYTSLDLDGKTPVPSTGFIAFPFSSLRSTYRAVAFAHGTVGVYRGCAPSNGPALFDYDSWQLLLARGYAVVATDYAGLGNNETLHKYCSFPAQANDVYYAMVAARAAFGGVLSREWVSVGHSEGGGAVWKLAESIEVLAKEEKHEYLGTVALAPATHIIDMAVAGLLDSGGAEDADAGGFASYAPSLAIGIQRYQPSYNLTLLGPKMRQRMAIAERAQVCATGLAGLTLDLALQDVVSLTGAVSDLALLQKWQSETAPSDSRAFAPLLVVQGLNDTSILPGTTEDAVKRACRGGSTVQLSLYPGVEHSPLLPASAPEWLSWIDARFFGQFLSKNCSTVTRAPFGNGAYMKLPPEDDMKHEYGL